MFTIEMLPAGYGDCLWIEYGNEGRLQRVLIDGGTRSTYPLLRERILRMKRPRRLDLLVVTHIDSDHIDGILPLVLDDGLELEFGDIWFNGWRHLVRQDELGPVAAERLTRAILERALPWNSSKPFNGTAIVVPDGGPLPAVELDGGMRLTVLSPGWSQLEKLATRRCWADAIKGTALDPDADVQPGELGMSSTGTSDEVHPDELGGKDTSVANGSSIALVAEFEGKSFLLAADAFPSVLQASVSLLCRARGLTRLPLDAFKLSHHGSRMNTTDELLGVGRVD